MMCCSDRKLLNCLFIKQNNLDRCINKNCTAVDDIMANLGCNKWRCSDGNCTGCEIVGSCASRRHHKCDR